MDDEKFDLYTSRVEEFLYLIDHAELICTDSFHACVFSILFNKPFLIVERKGMLNMKSRLDTLLELFGFQDRHIKFGKEEVDMRKILSVDFSKTKDIQCREIMKSMDFLKNAINIK